jgi:hypothetical protein
VRIAEKQLRPGEFRAALVLDILARDRQSPLSGEGLQLFPRARLASCSKVEALRYARTNIGTPIGP